MLDKAELQETIALFSGFWHVSIVREIVHVEGHDMQGFDVIRITVREDLKSGKFNADVEGKDDAGRWVALKVDRAVPANDSCGAIRAALSTLANYGFVYRESF